MDHQVLKGRLGISNLNAIFLKSYCCPDPTSQFCKLETSSD